MPVTLIKQNPAFDKKVEGENKLAIAEMFSDTLQGEGVNMGVPATFIRLQGCTLKCKWCFYENTKIVMEKGKSKKIKDLKSGDRILTLDQDENLVETTVKEVIENDVSIDEMMALYFDQKTDTPIICTKDHPFFIKNKGWVKASDILENDIVLGPSKKQVMGRKFSIYNNQKDPKNKAKSIKTRKERIAAGLIKPYKRTAAHRKAYSERMKGDKNPMKNPENVKKAALSAFRKKSGLEIKYEKFFQEHNLPIDYVGNNQLTVGNKEKGYKFPDFVVRDEKKVIEIYDTTMKYVINGKRTYRGKDWKNKISTHHSQFGYKTLILNEQDLKNKEQLKEKVFNFTFNGSKVTKINKQLNDKQKAWLYGSTDVKIVKVHNLSCEPYNTYLVDNGISHHKWVHNCDTLDVWPHGNEYSFEEIFELFDNIDLPERLKAGQHLVLTGGSPLKQQKRLISFIQSFIARYGFKPYIEIENEGVLFPVPEFEQLVDCWNNSPKLANSGMKERVRLKPDVIKHLNNLENSWFKFVIASQEDWEEIKNDYLPLISKEQVILMPEGITQDELNERREFVAEMAVKYGVRFSDRLHITIWNCKTGV